MYHQVQCRGWRLQCWDPHHFRPNDLMALGVDLVPIFWLVATLRERGSVATTSAEVCEGVDVGQPVAGDVTMEQPVISSVDSP
jgi:hypothetical protein